MSSYRNWPTGSQAHWLKDHLGGFRDVQRRGSGAVKDYVDVQLTEYHETWQLPLTQEPERPIRNPNEVLSPSTSVAHCEHLCRMRKVRRVVSSAVEGVQSIARLTVASRFYFCGGKIESNDLEVLSWVHLCFTE